jgi:bifunctional non-homologous end joining protein LigD
MLLASGTTTGSDEAWAYEVKWDGMRAQVRIAGRALEIRSRPGRLCTAQFPELASLADQLRGRKTILDAELVCLDHTGAPDFFALRRRLSARSSASVDRLRRTDPVCLMVFDLLHLDRQCVHRTV